MSHRSKIIKEWLDIRVTDPGVSFKDHFEVDKGVTRIIGIALTSNYDDLLYYRGSQRIAINDQEIYPENYESKMLMQGLNVPANDRIISLGQVLEVGNRKVEMNYTDTHHSLTAFVPYRVRLYVFSSIEE